MYQTYTIVGPISGTLVQPYIGILSDNCRISWGKRKPFMLAGGAATIISLVCLAWTREIVKTVLGKTNPHLPGVTIAFAVLMVYILDFSINTGTVIFLPSHQSILLTLNSPSWNKSIHRRQRSTSSARCCQRLG